MFLNLYVWSWIFEKTSKFWAASCKNESNLLLVQITVCIESCLPIGWHSFIWWKIRQRVTLFWFGLRNDEILYLQASTQRTIDIFPALWSTVWWKRSRVEHMQTVIRTSRRIRGLFAWSGSELGSCFKYSALKLKKSKTYSGWCPFQGLSNGTTLMQIQSGRTVPLRTDPIECTVVKSSPTKTWVWGRIPVEEAGEWDG